MVVPEIKPVLCKVSPVGSVPDAGDQLYGAVPPIAASVAEYAVPDVTADSAVVATESGFFTVGVIVTEAVPDLVESAELVAVTVADVLMVTAGAW